VGLGIKFAAQPADTTDTGWLVSKGRDQEALEILRTHHCGGDESDELAAFELREIQRTLSFEKEHSSGSWLDLVRTKGNRHRTWICVTCAIAAQASGTTLTGCKYTVSSLDIRHNTRKTS
jgi:hypothetical protein